jgi:hypothetical protein
MNLDLEITKDIVASMAVGFGGDGRAATVALRKISNSLKKYDSIDAKKIARDIIVAMGPSFEGNANRAVAALERILNSMVVRVKKKPGARGQVQEIDVRVEDD